MRINKCIRQKPIFTHYTLGIRDYYSYIFAVILSITSSKTGIDTLDFLLLLNNRFEQLSRL